MTVLNAYLLTAGGEGKAVVIVADEAQQMSMETLEQLRILSTLEAPGRKLLQIILVGQPELAAKLARTELRQLDQRIAVRCQLSALSERETARYIEHRLRAAGLGGSLPFTSSATARVHRATGGVPRLINLICDRALTAAFAARRRDVDVATVNTAVRSLRGHPARSRWAKPAAAAAVAVAALAGVAAGAVVIGRSGWSWPIAQSAKALVTPGVARPVSAAPADAAPAMPAPAASVATSPMPALDTDRRVLARLIGLWTLQSPPPNVIAGWPSRPTGAVDITRVAENFQLTATSLSGATAADLRAIGLPALIQHGDTDMLLLRRISGDTATLIDGTGAERQEGLGALESRLTSASVWLLWRNLDEVVTDGAPAMTPAMVLSVALRLHNLGHLAMPLPHSVYDPRFTRAVRGFQRATGLVEDGILGPRTTLALSRVVASALAPSIGAASTR
jgi:general secretion pathway protein A